MASDAPTSDTARSTTARSSKHERADLRRQLAELGFGDAGGLNYDSNFADSSQVTAERGEAEALAGELREAPGRGRGGHRAGWPRAPTAAASAAASRSARPASRRCRPPGSASPAPRGASPVSDPPDLAARREGRRRPAGQPRGPRSHGRAPAAAAATATRPAPPGAAPPRPGPDRAPDGHPPAVRHVDAHRRRRRRPAAPAPIRSRSDEIILFCVLVPSIILHEVAHGWVALAFGDDTAKRAGRLTLNPLAHIDPVGTIILPALMVLSRLRVLRLGQAGAGRTSAKLRSPRNQGVLVSLAGPATNVVLAALVGGRLPPLRRRRAIARIRPARRRVVLDPLLPRAGQHLAGRAST